MSLAAFFCVSAPNADACSADRVSVKDLQPRVVDDENISDAVVYLTGYIENRCPGMISVTVTMQAQGKDGAEIASHKFSVENVPAGGRSFDLTGAIPYDRGVDGYAVGALTVYDVGGLPARHR